MISMLPLARCQNAIHRTGAVEGTRRVRSRWSDATEHHCPSLAHGGTPRGVGIAHVAHTRGVSDCRTRSRQVSGDRHALAHRGAARGSLVDGTPLRQLSGRIAGERSAPPVNPSRICISGSPPIPVRTEQAREKLASPHPRGSDRCVVLRRAGEGTPAVAAGAVDDGAKAHRDFGATTVGRGPAEPLVGGVPPEDVRSSGGRLARGDEGHEAQRRCPATGRHVRH